ncbi:MAG: hypothetical protein R8G66_06170 [Cytophagales bacterium]|nr:hypothetical protein [Cytophagales bacterium]
MVKIDSLFFLPDDTLDHNISHHASFSIIELYRGDSISEINVSGSNYHLSRTMWTSCDLGLNPGEEWILFAYMASDSVLRTHYCTYSQLYRSENGQRDWHYRRGFKEIEKVKQILNIQELPNQTLNGQVNEKYPDGSIEVIAEYKNGLLNGRRIAYYTSGQLMAEDQYVNGKREGQLNWFFKNGSLKRKYSYHNNQPIDSCWNFHRNGNIANRNFYSRDGQALYESSYSEDGILDHTYEVDTLTDMYVRTVYYGSGIKRHETTNQVGEYLDGNTTQYHPNGQVEATWTYFETGEFYSEIKKWNESGELSFHQKTNWKGEKTVIMDNTKNKP